MAILSAKKTSKNVGAQASLSFPAVLNLEKNTKNYNTLHPEVNGVSSVFVWGSSHTKPQFRWPWMSRDSILHMVIFLRASDLQENYYGRWFPNLVETFRQIGSFP